jgi:phospholipid N-methyltransferase
MGAVLPSSRHLARRLLEGHDLEHGAIVVELGPGTGAITRHIEKRLGPATRCLALELDAQASRLLQRRHPRVTVINDSAENLGRHLTDHGAERAESIISGIPWAAMSPSLQRTMLAGLAGKLAPGGRFSTFTYIQSPHTRKGAACAQLLQQLFARVQRSPTVWRNFPPAFVYHCEQPR